MDNQTFRSFVDLGLALGLGFTFGAAAMLLALHLVMQACIAISRFVARVFGRSSKS